VNRRDGHEPLSGRPLAKDRAVLHRLFNLAERLEYRDGNPVSRVQPPKYDGRDPVLLTEDQYEALLRECE
jgi:site-specific recombinase XerD